MFSAKEIILSEIKPALGCTEPAAIALNGAYLKSINPHAETITLTINTNLLKNAAYVPIPNTNRSYGVKFAFALGYLFGDKNDGLNIFKNITPQKVKKAKEFEKNIELNIKEGNEIYIKSMADEYEVLTYGYHDFIKLIKTPEKTMEFSSQKTSSDTKTIENWLKNQDFEIIYSLLDEDFSFLKDTVDMNLNLSNTAFSKECGLNIGKSHPHNTLENKIISVTTAASDARMEGVNAPAMSLFGSGNHGIAATLPVWIYAKEKGFSENEAYRAIGLSMLITIYIKLFIGRLSPVCGAAFASGCGVGGAIAYLEKGKTASINAVKFVINSINGVICDGAKMGCSLKVMLGAQNGYKAAMLAIKDTPVFEDGILEKDITKTIKNLQKITDSMKKVDKTITDIMISKQLSQTQAH